MKKYILCGILFASLFGLAGCGQKAADSGSSGAAVTPDPNAASRADEAKQAAASRAAAPPPPPAAQQGQPK